jgi:hypothetical protein
MANRAFISRSSYAHLQVDPFLVTCHIGSRGLCSRITSQIPHCNPSPIRLHERDGYLNAIRQIRNPSSTRTRSHGRRGGVFTSSLGLWWAVDQYWYGWCYDT